jgi:hypothetical protein
MKNGAVMVGNPHAACRDQEFARKGESLAIVGVQQVSWGAGRPASELGGWAYGK